MAKKNVEKKISNDKNGVDQELPNDDTILETESDITVADPVLDELENCKSELEKKNDLLMRTAAEYENFKKRTERERIALAEFIKAQTVEALLPTLDNIDRALSSDSSSPDYIKGIELIVKQLGESIAGLGLVETAAVGDVFNPAMHEAVMHVKDESIGENVIVQVLQKGYKIGDTVVRPAMVQVAN